MGEGGHVQSVHGAAHCSPSKKLAGDGAGLMQPVYLPGYSTVDSTGFAAAPWEFHMKGQPVFASRTAVAIAADCQPAKANGDGNGWITGTAALPAASAYTTQNTEPATDLANGLVVVRNSAGKIRCGLKLIGEKSTDPNDIAFTGRIWLGKYTIIDGVTYEVNWTHAMDLAPIVGNSLIPSDSELSVGLSASTDVMKAVDTFTVSNDRTLTPGYQILGGDAADTFPELVFDCADNDVVRVALNKGTLDGVRLIARFF